MIWITEIANLLGLVGALLSFPLVFIPTVLIWALWRSAQMQNKPQTGTFRRFTGNKSLILILLALAGVAYLLDISDRLGWLNAFKSEPPLIGVFDKTFSNQVVVVDGNDFVRCTFNNVTFRYRGGNYSFQDAHISGGVFFDSDNLVAANAITLFKFIDGFTENHALLSNWKELPPEHFK